MPSKRRPQGDGTIRKRADGRWEGRIIIGHKKNGSPIFKSVFGKTQKSALKQLHLLIDLYRDVDLTEECRMTLGEWLDKWLNEYMVFTIKESTIDGYRKMINNQIKRFLGEKQLAYQGRRTKKSQRSVSSVQDYLRAFRVQKYSLPRPKTYLCDHGT